MERSKRKKVVNGEFHLPEHIIQYIQSFMSGKEATQTAILSKPWHSAWSTRPNLDLVECYKQPSIEFEKTMQRYEELNLNIQSFRLRMHCFTPDKISLACELIVKAMRMGAVDLDLYPQTQRDRFVLPQEVLGSETLIRLSVANCKIDLGPELKVLSSLKSLILRSVYTGGDIIWVIVSNCPLIEILELSECKCLFVHDGNVGWRTRMLVLKPGRAFDKPNNRFQFHKLKSLLLEKVEIGTWIFDDFSSRFPCLKDLALHHCSGYKEIQIYSRSLERISFTLSRTLRATFDVPNVRKFKFSSSCIPSMSFKTTTYSRQWESDISIACTRISHCLSSSWFSKLNEFLTDLSPSEISLSLTLAISSKKSSGNYVIKGTWKRPAVENLMLSMCAPSGVCSDLLDGLFSSCRPKLITLLWIPFGRKANNDFVKILCKTLIKEVNENCFVPNNSTCELHDLEEVTVECFGEIQDEWRPLCWKTWPLCWKTLLDASPSSGNKRKIRFQLRWQMKHEVM